MITLKYLTIYVCSVRSGAGLYEHIHDDGTIQKIVNITLLDKQSRLSTDVVST